MTEAETAPRPDPAAEPPPGGPPPALPDLEDKTVPALRELCKKRGLDFSGKRRELIDRLRAALTPLVGRHRDGRKTAGTVCPQCGEPAVVRSAGQRGGLKRYYRCAWCRTRFPLAKAT